MPLIGEASPPGSHRNLAPARTAPSREADPPRTHEFSDPLPDAVFPDAGAPAETTPEAPVAEVAPGTVWEDPSGRLAPWLQSVRAHQQALRVVQLGDSHTEGDAFTGPLRRRLWAQLGDGGRGFVPVAGTQWDVARSLTGPWRVLRSGLRASDGPNGLGLARAVATSPAASLRVATCTRCPGGQRADRVTVFFRVLDGGGHLVVDIDGTSQRISTRADGSVVVTVADGPHAVTVRPAGDGPVEVYGVALDRGTTGARLDAAGVVGAQATHLRDEDWTVLAPQLAARDPTLVVFSFGTNESASARRDPAVYATALTTLIERVRVAVPTTSVAVFGPPDVELRSVALPGTFIPAPRLDGVIEAARATAMQQGTWFVDQRGLMGGAGAMSAWALESPPWAAPDHVHLTNRGYARLANAVADGLLGAPAAP